jgi:hypothetical protein
MGHLQNLVLNLRPLPSQLRLPHRPPHERRRAAVRRGGVGAERHVIGALEVRPVQRYHGFFARARHEPHPRLERLVRTRPTSRRRRRRMRSAASTACDASPRARASTALCPGPRCGRPTACSVSASATVRSASTHSARAPSRSMSSTRAASGACSRPRSPPKRRPWGRASSCRSRGGSHARRPRSSHADPRKAVREEDADHQRRATRRAQASPSQSHPADKDETPLQDFLLFVLSDEIARSQSTASQRRADEAGLDPDMVAGEFFRAVVSSLLAETWSGRRDLNPRRRAPKARALPDCATPRGTPIF